MRQDCYGVHSLNIAQRNEIRITEDEHIRLPCNEGVCVTGQQRRRPSSGKDYTTQKIFFKYSLGESAAFYLILETHSHADKAALNGSLLPLERKIS